MISPGPVNVRDFGAVGDGVTDDTAAFMAAQEEAVNRNPNTALALNLVRGGNVVYVPPGLYRANVYADNRCCWLGDKHQTVIMSFADDGWAFDFHLPPPHQLHRWQRPFIQNIAIQGGLPGGTHLERIYDGLKIENWYGVDLIDVQFYRCKTAIYNAQNFYGTWDRLIIYECDLGMHFANNGSNTHMGNKRIINPQIRKCGTAVLIEHRISRTAFYGGTIEGCRTGVAFYHDEASNWKDVSALALRDVWFEANRDSNMGPPLVFPNGTDVRVGDIHMEKGTVLLDNCGASHVYIGPEGRLYSIYSFVGRGPASAYLEVAEGGFVGYRHSLLPFPDGQGVQKLWPEV